MSGTDLRGLYWPGPFRGLYQALQAASGAAAAPRLRELLSARQEWLLGGLGKFKPPSAASRRAAEDAFKAGKLVLGAASAAGAGAASGGGSGGQRVTLDARMEQAALALSGVLGLDEVQTVLLLRRFAADTGARLAPPPQEQQQQQQQQQVRLDAPQVADVLQYYYSERLYLLKCLQFLAAAAEGDRGGECARALGALLRRGLAGSVFAALMANLGGGGAAAGAGGTPATTAQTTAPSFSGALVVASAGSAALFAAGTAAAPPPDLLPRRHLQLLHERCELLALLARLYELHSSGVADELGGGEKENAAAGAKGKAAAGDGGDGGDAYDDAATLFGPDRFTQLLQALRRSALRPRAASAAADRGAAGELARLSEALAAALVVAAMRPAHLIELVSRRALGGGALAAKGRSVAAELAGWGGGGAGAAVALLTWAAFAKLVATEAGGIGELFDLKGATSRKPADGACPQGGTVGFTDNNSLHYASTPPSPTHNTTHTSLQTRSAMRSRSRARCSPAASTRSSSCSPRPASAPRRTRACSAAACCCRRSASSTARSTSTPRASTAPSSTRSSRRRARSSPAAPASPPTCGTTRCC